MHLELMRKNGNTGSPFFKLCSLELPRPSAISENEEKMLPKWVLDLVFRPWLPRDLYQKHPLTERQRILFEENIEIDRTKAYRLCSFTIDQAKNPLWHRNRQIPITGSKV